MSSIYATRGVIFQKSCYMYRAPRGAFQKSNLSEGEKMIVHSNGKWAETAYQKGSKDAVLSWTSCLSSNRFCVLFCPLSFIVWSPESHGVWGYVVVVEYALPIVCITAIMCWNWVNAVRQRHISIVDAGWSVQATSTSEFLQKQALWWSPWNMPFQD